MKVPFLDLAAQYNSIKNEIDEAIAGVIRDCSFIGGKPVVAFERAFAEMVGMNHCISAGNGTDTLYIIMKMLGIGAGDEVITVANSWISSSETITQTGARAVFIDVHPEYYSMDETRLEEQVNSRTKALIAVHLQGQMCEMEKLVGFCRKHNLFLIEDCAQSHLSAFNDRLAGTFGIAASFSFYPGKNLGAYGDAGCIVTNDDALAEKFRRFARHGALIKHEHSMEGINSRMDGMQAAILLRKMKYIASWNEARIQHAACYTRGLEGIRGIVTPKIRPGTRHTFHLYVVRAERRKDLAEFLKQKEIETVIHYPTPLPFLEAYRYMNHVTDDFPVASRLQPEILSLPIYPEITTEQIDHVVASVKEFYRQ